MTFYLILTTYSKVSITISNLKIRKLRLREGKPCPKSQSSLTPGPIHIGRKPQARTLGYIEYKAGIELIT